MMQIENRLYRRISQKQDLWNQALEKLNGLEKERNTETRYERRSQLDGLIKDATERLNKINQELEDLESNLQPRSVSCKVIISIKIDQRMDLFKYEELLKAIHGLIKTINNETDNLEFSINLIQPGCTLVQLETNAETLRKIVKALTFSQQSLSNFVASTKMVEMNWSIYGKQYELQFSDDFNDVTIREIPENNMIKPNEFKCDLLSPMLKIDGHEGGDILKTQLRNWLRFQLDSLINGPEAGSINLILKSEIDWLIRSQTWPRIQSSLRQLQEFFFADETSQIMQDLKEIWELNLFEPFYDPSRIWVTTPSLLLVQAILYSHREWTQPFYHDVWSAGQARRDLQGRKIPEEFINKVAAMIAFLNLFRNGLMEPKEAGIWLNRKDFCQDDDKVQDTLAREIFRLWEIDWKAKDNNMTIALSAVAACSLSHERRGIPLNTGPGQIFLNKCEQFKKLYHRVTNYLKHNSQPDEIKWEPNQDAILCSFEFANYVFDPVDKERSDKFQQFAKKLLTNTSLDESIQLFFCSFGRFWSNREINNYRKKHIEDIDSSTFFAVEDATFYQVLREGLLDQDNKTKFAHLKLKPEQRFELFFDRKPRSLPEGPEGFNPEQVWSWIDDAIEWFQERRPWGFDGVDYLPFGAVDRIIRVIEKIWPNAFIIGRINWPEPSPAISQIGGGGYTVILPRDYQSVIQKINEIEEIEKRNGETQELLKNTRIVIARYAAVAILNQRMAYGSGSLQLILDADENTSKGWYEIINWVEKKNKHETLRYYLDQVSSPFHDKLVKTARTAIQFPEDVQEPFALCVDVGATGVKAELWSVNIAERILEIPSNESDRKPCRYYTTLGPNKRYVNGKHFAERLRDEVKNQFGESIFNKLIFIGITWPGVVVGEPGAEYVAGTSGIMGYFKGLSNQILDNTTDKIHNLRIREGLEEVFTKAAGGRPVFIRLINDGEAHTRASLKQFPEEIKGKGCRVTLTAGTGTALGVIPNNEPIPAIFLAEVGKFVLNLFAPFPKETDNFPTGVANKIYSQKTTPTIAENIVTGKNPVKLRSGEWSVNREDYEQVLPFYPLEIAYWLSGTEESTRPDEDLLNKWHKEDALDALEQYEFHWLAADLAHDQGIINRRKLNIETQVLGTFPARPAEISEFSSDETILEIKIKNWLTPWENFGLVVAHRAGCLLADLAAICVDLFQADGLFCTGGPMSGETGKFIRAFARQELNDLYGFKIIQSDFHPVGYRPHFVRAIEFPEPIETKNKKHSGAWGVGSAALEHYLILLKEAELQNMEDILREHLEKVQPDVKEGMRIRIRLVEHYALIELLDEGGNWAELDRIRWHDFNSIEHIADYLEIHRVRRGLYAGKLEGSIYTCIFVGPPDSILRH